MLVNQPNQIYIFTCGPAELLLQTDRFAKKNFGQRVVINQKSFNWIINKQEIYHKEQSVVLIYLSNKNLK